MKFDEEGHPAPEHPDEAPPDGLPEASSEQASEITMDDLFHFDVDREEVEKAQRELLLPDGTYTTQPPPKMNLGTDKTGRKYARFFVPVVAVYENKRGAIGYRISWERRNKRDPDTQEDTGKPDLAYRLYLQADKAYERVTGTKAENPGQIVQYLHDYPHRVRITQFTGDNMVVAISPVFEGS